MVATIIAVLIPLEVYDWLDSALFLYSVAVFVLALCLVPWTLWVVLVWLKTRKRLSTMFLMVWILLLSVEYSVCWQLYSRWNVIYNPEVMAQIRWSVLWAYRILPEVFILTWFFAWIVGRIFGVAEVKSQLPIGVSTPRVLIVDDNKDITEILSKLVGESGLFTTCIAHNCKDAAMMFEQSRFVCAFVDLNLDGTVESGLDLLEIMRREDKHIILIAISGYLSNGLKDRLASCADDVLPKPFDTDIFRIKLFLWSAKYKRRVMNSTESGMDAEFQMAYLIEDKLKSLFKR
jgi:CheY-like chemotaxis protein